MTDLWCLFDFVQPGLLGALNEFGRRYRRPIEAQTDEEKARVEELRARIKPQIIRRTKAESPRTCRGNWNRITRFHSLPHQRALYAHAIDSFRKRNNPNVLTPFKNHLGLLQYLRLICTDPRRHGMEAFKPEPLAEYRYKAPKLHWLLESPVAHSAPGGKKPSSSVNSGPFQRLLKYYIEQVFSFSPDIINGDTPSLRQGSG